MSQWIKTVEIDEIVEGQLYFLGRNVAADPFVEWRFDATDMKGRHIMSVKPGIANRFRGSEKLKQLLRECPELKAVPIPADAHKRWTRRKRLL